uniref:Uncharacterized protein n=1 Tax=Heterorhabditis bacteriophora TaxID=37862 RepID=A0A1I7WM74_HETBA
MNVNALHTSVDDFSESDCLFTPMSSNALEEIAMELVYFSLVSTDNITSPIDPVLASDQVISGLSIYMSLLQNRLQDIAVRAISPFRRSIGQDSECTSTWGQENDTNTDCIKNSWQYQRESKGKQSNYCELKWNDTIATRILEAENLECELNSQSFNDSFAPLFVIPKEEPNLVQPKSNDIRDGSNVPTVIYGSVDSFSGGKSVQENEENEVSGSCDLTLILHLFITVITPSNPYIYIYIYIYISVFQD